MLGKGGVPVLVQFVYEWIGGEINRSKQKSMIKGDFQDMLTRLTT